MDGPLSDAAIARHRQDFPALDEGIYANFGARGVMSRAAIAAVADTLNLLQSAGPASRIGAAIAARETLALRRALGDRLGVGAERVALVENVSHACAAAFWGISWRAGDTCLIGAHEPPGTLIVARQIAARFGVELLWFDAGGGADWRERLDRALRPTTRLIVLSHVDWITGAVVPLAALVDIVRAGPAAGAAIAIDGAQAVGAMAVDLSGLDLDLYAVAGQKWLGGPDGVAAMIVPPAPGARLAPSLIGWRAVGPAPDGDDIALARDATRFETGTAAFALFSGLRQAMQDADGFASVAARAARIAGLTRRLRAGLAAIGEPLVLLEGGDHGIVSFTADHLAAAEIVARLERCGIVAKAHVYPACVRLCVHYLTLQTEIDAMIAAIGEMLSARDPPVIAQPSVR